MTETVLSCGECNNKDQYKDILNKSRDLNGKKKKKEKKRKKSICENQEIHYNTYELLMC